MQDFYFFVPRPEIIIKFWCEIVFHEFDRRSRKYFENQKSGLSSHIGGPRAVQKNIMIIYFRAIYHVDQLTSLPGGATTDDVAACFWDLIFAALQEQHQQEE